MIQRLLCLIFGHKTNLEYQATFNDKTEVFNYAFYRCHRCRSLVWDDSKPVPRDTQKDIVLRRDLEQCKSEHSEVSQ